MERGREGEREHELAVTCIIWRVCAYICMHTFTRKDIAADCKRLQGRTPTYYLKYITFVIHTYIHVYNPYIYVQIMYNS